MPTARRPVPGASQCSNLSDRRTPLAMVRRAASWIVLLGAVALHAQPPSPPRDMPPSRATPTATIRGHVVSASDGAVLRNARVALAGPDAPDPAFTDGDGRFEFAALQPGRYFLTTSKAGYVRTRFGARQRTEPAAPVDLAPNTLLDVEVRMRPSGAISGRIVDEFGEPLVDVTVEAQQVVNRDRAKTQTAMATVTDDLGEYRLGGLSDGRYVVAARRRIGELMTQAYYPGTPSLSSADAVVVHTGEEQPSINFTLADVQTSSRLLLTFVDPTGTAVIAGANLVSADREGTSAASDNGIAVTGNGLSDRFSLLVPSGEWIVNARAVYAPLVGLGHVTMGSTDQSLRLQMHPGGRIAGRVVADGGVPPADPIVLDARPLDPALTNVPGPGRPPTRARAGETFTIEGLVGRVELRVIGAPRGWAVRSIEVGGRTVLDTPIEFNGDETMSGVVATLTHQLGTLSGRIDAPPSVAFDSSILVFPEVPASTSDLARLARWVRPNQTGEFAVDSLLPGRYLVVVTRDVDETRWPDASYLEQFRSKATLVTLTANEKTEVTLRLESES